MINILKEINNLFNNELGEDTSNYLIDNNYIYFILKTNSINVSVIEDVIDTIREYREEFESLTIWIGCIEIYNSNKLKYEIYFELDDGRENNLFEIEKELNTKGFTLIG